MASDGLFADNDNITVQIVRHYALTDKYVILATGFALAFLFIIQYIHKDTLVVVSTNARGSIPVASSDPNCPR